MKKIFLFTLILLCFSSCKEFKEISVSKINGFKINRLSTDGLEADINVVLNNPNTMGFKIYKSKADVFISDTKIGTARILKKVKVQANSNTEHVFTLNGDLKSMNFNSLLSIISGKSKSVSMKGYIKAGKWFYKKKFPINETNNINIKQFNPFGGF